MRISDWSSDVCSSDLAIAEPERSPRPRDWKPFASIGYWPGHGVRGQLHIRLSRQKREGSAVLLKIDDRTWQLIGGGNNAWAPDRRADAEIVAAMRTEIGRASCRERVCQYV